MAVIAAGIWIAYSVGDGIYGVAVVAAALLSMVGIMVAAAILTLIGMPTVPTSPILMAILSISTNAMDSTHVRLILMTAALTILALIAQAPSSDNGLIAASPATVVIIRARMLLFPCPDQHRMSSVQQPSRPVPVPGHRSPTKRCRCGQRFACVQGRAFG